MSRALTLSSLALRRLLVMGLQLLMVAVANIAAFALRFDGQPPEWALASCAQMLPWLLVIRALTFIPFRLHEGLWRYTSIYDLRTIITAVGTSSAVFTLVALSPFG